MIRLRQRQDWYNSVYQTPSQWDPVFTETTDLYFWDTDGATGEFGPFYDPYPWAIRSYATQKFKLTLGGGPGFNLQVQHLSTGIQAGPGSVCYMSPTNGGS